MLHNQDSCMFSSG